jgi:hypothetical protein
MLIIIAMLINIILCVKVKIMLLRYPAGSGDGKKSRDISIAASPVPA